MLGIIFDRHRGLQGFGSCCCGSFKWKTIATADLGELEESAAVMDETHIYNVIELVRVDFSHVVHATQTHSGEGIRKSL